MTSYDLWNRSLRYDRSRIAERSGFSLTVIHFSEIASPSEFSIARELFREYAEWLGVDLCFQGFSEELDRLPEMYGPPSGALVLARRDDHVVGCVGVRSFRGETCEMKRLFVRRAARQAGVGRRLAVESVQIARRLGYRHMVLDTLEEMTAARRIYSDLGFVETGPYYENPLPGVRYMSLDLRAKIQAVLFDLGNTLVDYYHGPDFPPILRQSLLAVAETLALDVDDEEGLLRRGLELNAESPEFAIRPLKERITALFPSAAAASEAMMDRCCRSFLAPIFARAHLGDDALDVLDALRSRGLRTAVVSNTPWGSPAEPWLEELERHDLLRRLDAVTFCVDVGWRKPHPAPFLNTLNRLSVDAAHALFVGDDPRWDIEGSRNAGLRSVLRAPAASTDKTIITIAPLRGLIDIVDALR